MRLEMLRGCVAGLLAAVLAVPVGVIPSDARPQEQKKEKEPQREYSISVEVPLVNVDVVVADTNGDLIPGLKKGNFRILEDGVPQKVTNFAPTEAPITIVMVVEFSRLAFDYFAYKSTSAAYDFLRYLSKDDWVALVTFDLKSRVEVDFTRNKFELQEALARMYFPGFSEANLFDALITTLDQLQDVKGKKSILVLASGLDTFSKHTLDDTLKRLRQSDVTIFTIGVARDFYEYYDNRGLLSGPTRMSYLQAENQLATFARMTGGKYWSPRFYGELPNIFREVAAMLRNQYSLGYTPTNQVRDGKFRKIKVEVVGEDGNPLVVVDQKGKKVKYVVYAREGYVAPKGNVGD